MALVMVWLRLSTNRQLPWYKNSSYQSKDIAHVQKTLAQRMADKVCPAGKAATCAKWRAESRATSPGSQLADEATVLMLKHPCQLRDMQHRSLVAKALWLVPAYACLCIMSHSLTHGVVAMPSMCMRVWVNGCAGEGEPGPRVPPVCAPRPGRSAARRRRWGCHPHGYSAHHARERHPRGSPPGELARCSPPAQHSFSQRTQSLAWAAAWLWFLSSVLDLT